MPEKYIYDNRPTYHQVQAPLKKPPDPSHKLLSWFGTGLIAAFFMPIVIIGGGLWKIYFFNIEILLKPGIDTMVKFQMIYPLAAGILLKIFSNRPRTPVRSLGILLVGLLPFLVLFFNKEVQAMISQLDQYIPGASAIKLRAILGGLGMIALLGGAHTIRIQPKHDIAVKVTAAGGALYCFSHILSIRSGFSLFAPFKTMGQEDPTGLGLNLVSGIAELIVLFLLIAAAAVSIQLYKQTDPVRRELKGNSIITLWALHLFVYGAVFVYIIIATVVKSISMGGPFLLIATTFFVKFVPWLLGLYIMIPLGVGEILLSMRRY